jgi:glycine/D-amino acid oxidase-like deaminating enzyme
MSYRSLSFWLDSLPGDLSPRDPLPGDLDVDVAIAGAGFTGLWTAYYLASASPGLRIAVCEQEIAGFGASGRNGGWCSAYFPASLAKLERMAGRDQAIAMYRAMEDTVDEVGRVVAAEDIDCHWAKGGALQLARSPAQLERAIEHINESRSYGFGAEDVRLLTAAETAEQVTADGLAGATYTPHCAAIHPARLARGLAEAVRGRGVRVFEDTPVTEIAPGRLRTTRGTVRAQYVIRATEGYTPGLPGLHRAIAPVYSLMIATAPLPESVWDEIGLASRPTFGDYRHLIIYGQRTADGRLAFGGRGPSSTAPPRCSPRCAGRCRTCSPPWARSRSRTPGAARWGCPGTGARPPGSTGPPGSAGPAGTSGTACPPPTWPAGPWPTWSCRTTVRSPGCPGSGTGRGRGRPSRCAGSARTPGCRR